MWWKLRRFPFSFRCECMFSSIVPSSLTQIPFINVHKRKWKIIAKSSKMSTDFTRCDVTSSELQTKRICARYLLDSPYLLYYLIFWRIWLLVKINFFYFHLFYFNHNRLTIPSKQTHFNELFSPRPKLNVKRYSMYGKCSQLNQLLMAKKKMDSDFSFFFLRKNCLFHSFSDKQMIQYEKWLCKFCQWRQKHSVCFPHQMLLSTEICLSTFAFIFICKTKIFIFGRTKERE